MVDGVYEVDGRPALYHIYPLRMGVTGSRAPDACACLYATGSSEVGACVVRCSDLRMSSSETKAQDVGTRSPSQAGTSCERFLITCDVPFDGPYDNLHRAASREALLAEACGAATSSILLVALSDVLGPGETRCVRTHKPVILWRSLGESPQDGSFGEVLSCDKLGTLEHPGLSRRLSSSSGTTLLTRGSSTLAEVSGGRLLPLASATSSVGVLGLSSREGLERSGLAPRDFECTFSLSRAFSSPSTLFDIALSDIVESRV